MYKSKKDEESAIKMSKEWHPFVSIKRKGSRVDMKTEIRKMAEFYQKIVK